MTDVELQALAALVIGWSAEVTAANQDRAQAGYAMAYNGLPCADALKALEDELRRRQAIPCSCACHSGACPLAPPYCGHGKCIVQEVSA